MQKSKKLAEASFLIWLGYEDSNLGMLVSETRALPLGDTPTGASTKWMTFCNWLGYEDSNLGMLVSETRALPLGDTPTIYWIYRTNRYVLNMVATTGFEPVTPSL